MRGLTSGQWAVLLGLAVAIAACRLLAPAMTVAVLHTTLVAGFVLSACSKLALAALGSEPVAVRPLQDEQLPTYTIIAALYREAQVVAQLISAIQAIDYPRDRLQVVLALEEDDRETFAAVTGLGLPDFIEVLVKRPEGPRTKPNALNAALGRAYGELLTIYDAEDIPHPSQLREAAARFAKEPALVCLQAPLRIGNPRSGFLARQFALEYAGQFEAVLPGLAAAGAPFPLGGTSNHFRTSSLRRLNGWDAFNVTEDADLGFRIGSGRRSMGVLAAPTHEDAPTRLREWLPQRSRWVKGYIQTWGVHTRNPGSLGVRGHLSMQATLGAAIVGAALHAPLVVMLLTEVVLNVRDRVLPFGTVADVAVLMLGWSMAVVANGVGASRAGLRVGLGDALASLAYWPLQTLAFLNAVRQLAVDPFRWDKTPHRPSAPSPVLDEGSPRRVSPGA